MIAWLFTKGIAVIIAVSATVAALGFLFMFLDIPSTHVPRVPENKTPTPSQEHKEQYVHTVPPNPNLGELFDTRLTNITRKWLE